MGAPAEVVADGFPNVSGVMGLIKVKGYNTQLVDSTPWCSTSMD